jgi:hypothetical protein
VQRITDQDHSDIMLLDQVREFVEIIADPRPLQSRQTLRRDPERIAPRDSNPPFSDIERHHTSRHVSQGNAVCWRIPQRSIAVPLRTQARRVYSS